MLVTVAELPSSKLRTQATTVCLRVLFILWLTQGMDLGQDSRCIHGVFGEKSVC